LPGDPTLNGDPAPNLINAHPDLNNMSDPITAFLLTNDVNNTSVLGDQLYFQNSGVETRIRRPDTDRESGTPPMHCALRWVAGTTRDHNSTFFSDYYNLFAPATFVQQTATKFTWRVGADYDLTPTNLVYGSVSTGFKPAAVTSPPSRP